MNFLFVVLQFPPFAGRNQKALLHIYAIDCNLQLELSSIGFSGVLTSQVRVKTIKTAS